MYIQCVTPFTLVLTYVSFSDVFCVHVSSVEACAYVSVSFEVTVASVTAHYAIEMLLCEPLAGTSLHGRSITIKHISRRP